jgi:hypothetical protein
MIVIAASLYLPEHISIIANRVFYYWGGEYYDEPKAAATLQQTAKNTFSGPLAD